MRRKSERNKVKGTPEKKTEKPTRKSLRRRGKTSPSTSPERDNMDDNVSSTPYSDDEGETQVLEKIQEEEADKEVSSSGLIKSVLGEENDNGSVWKVARADASPGEIQKLKLCRQRSNLETPDNFLGKKKSNKWPDSGDGSIDEGDLVVEQSMSPMETFINLNANDPSSSRLSQVPDEEVSDFKKTLTETTSANLSDVKTNVDQQPDYKGELPELSSENSQQENRDLSQEHQFYEEDPLKDIQPQEDTNDSQPYNSNCGGMVNQEVIDGNFTEVTTSEISTVDVQQSNVSQMEISEPDLCKKNEIRDDNVQLDSNLNKDSNDKNIFNNNADKTEMSDFVNQGNINSISNSEESNTKTNNESTEMESNNKDTNNIKEFVEAGQEDTGGVSSQENTENYLVSEKESNLKDTSHSTKRKHYNKYDDSSNSESQDSDEESGEIRDDKSSPEPQDKLKEEEKLKTQNSQSNIEYDIEMSENTKDDVLEINEKIDDMNSSMTVSVSKPAKVCLKRSFSARVSTDSENKKEDMYKIDDNELNQNKENCAANDQPDSKNAPKKRRWGITSTPADVLPAFSISTDSLKELVPGAKPLSASEVRLSKDDDEHKDHKYKNDVDSQLKKKENQTHRQRDSKLDNHVARKITVGNDVQRHRSPSPQDAQPTNILLIKNLVRPFTLNQIKELLSRTGTIVENGFWMDRIKSKCFVEYTNEDQAFETRQALHGTSWPLSNPKKLQVEYSTKEAMNSARDVSKEQTFPRKAEQNAVSDTWQNDWAREERPSVNNKTSVIREWDLGKEDGHLSLKERERERKEFEKRRRQRSPIIEVHLPAPARKFKKKEEEPPTAKLLDDLFRKTKATPCIYWLPLTNEQIIVKEEMRRQHMAEHARRLEEMRRLERNRDSRRRRSPRK